MDVFEDIKQYVEQNRRSTETRLFAFLALMNSYIPESFLLKSECQTVLGPPDPIHGGPPLEERMAPFTAIIDTSYKKPCKKPSKKPNRVFMKPEFAHEALAVLTDPQIKKEIKRSTIVKKLMSKLCGDQAQEDTVQFVKDLLTKREMGENGKKKFSRLIEDIQKNEDLPSAILVLEKASKKMARNPVFPQTLARLYYIEQRNYEEAEKWAKIAIERARNSSYIADTLGQVYKNHLLGIDTLSRENLPIVLKALRAFKDVEEKAEAGAEARKEMNVSFNTGGHYGFMQVAKITYEKIQKAGFGLQRHVQSFKHEVEEKFSFFEWYLAYSRPSKASLEQRYIWEDVALCYQYYTEKKATDSTSFPGLLDCLNHGLFTSKGSHARLKGVKRKTVSDLEAVCDHLKTNFEANGDIKAAQLYILSNIILSNKTQNSSPKVSPVRDLQKILHKFFGTKVRHRSPEFYLLVLMLFWPEDPERVVEVEGGEEVKCSAPKLSKQVAFMEQAFESVGYAKYLGGRYLLPLFFLGKGSGLNKWIHKSTLDAIVEEKVDAELACSMNGYGTEKWKRICGYWSSGKVWQIPEIQEILLPVEIASKTSQSQGEEKRAVRVKGFKITATAEFESDDSALSFYLGLTIKGPVVFKVEKPVALGQ